ncbi:MAG: hypothetical protein K9M57_08220, partial [Phycisphaerae bacterium]|nr:hypothetical protein [Phycisphaerae bacterium]
MIRIREISVGFKVGVEELRSFVLDRLGVGDEALIGFSVVRRAIDARHGRHILAIYTVDVEVADEAAVLERFEGDARVGVAPNMSYQMPEVGSPGASGKRPVVVGCGPCGLFIGLILAQKGLRPLLIERGRNVLERVKDINAFWHEGTLLDESNVQFGEGGAGTFSDGKLNTQIKDKLNRSRKVLEEFVKAGGPTEILYQAKPHLGTDNLVRIVKNIREEIIALGGEVRFETKLTGIEIAD